MRSANGSPLNFTLITCNDPNLRTQIGLEKEGTDATKGRSSQAGKSQGSHPRQREISDRLAYEGRVHACVSQKHCKLSVSELLQMAGETQKKVGELVSLTAAAPNGTTPD